MLYGPSISVTVVALVYEAFRPNNMYSKFVHFSSRIQEHTIFEDETKLASEKYFSRSGTGLSNCVYEVTSWIGFVRVNLQSIQTR